MNQISTLLHRPQENEPWKSPNEHGTLQCVGLKRGVPFPSWKFGSRPAEAKAKALAFAFQQ